MEQQTADLYSCHLPFTTFSPASLGKYRRQHLALISKGGRTLCSLTAWAMFSVYSRASVHTEKQRVHPDGEL